MLTFLISIELTQEELQEIEDASAHITITGTRYTEQWKSQEDYNLATFMRMVARSARRRIQQLQVNF